MFTLTCALIKRLKITTSSTIKTYNYEGSRYESKKKKGTNDPFQKVTSVCLCSGGYILIKDVEFKQEQEPTSDYWQDVRERAAIAVLPQCLKIVPMGYTYTRIWRVEHKLVVADTIEEAVEIYKTWAESIGDLMTTDITTIKAVGDNQIPEEFDAIIKK